MKAKDTFGESPERKAAEAENDQDLEVVEDQVVQAIVSDPRYAKIRTWEEFRRVVGTLRASEAVPTLTPTHQILAEELVADMRAVMLGDVKADSLPPQLQELGEYMLRHNR